MKNVSMKRSGQSGTCEFKLRSRPNLYGHNEEKEKKNLFNALQNTAVMTTLLNAFPITDATKIEKEYYVVKAVFFQINPFLINHVY